MQHWGRVKKSVAYNKNVYFIWLRHFAQPICLTASYIAIDQIAGISNYEHEKNVWTPQKWYKE